MISAPGTSKGAENSSSDSSDASVAPPAPLLLLLLLPVLSAPLTLALLAWLGELVFDLFRSSLDTRCLRKSSALNSSLASSLTVDSLCVLPGDDEILWCIELELLAGPCKIHQKAFS